MQSKPYKITMDTVRSFTYHNPRDNNVFHSTGFGAHLGIAPVVPGMLTAMYALTSAQHTQTDHAKYVLKFNGLVRPHQTVIANKDKLSLDVHLAVDDQRKVLSLVKTQLKDDDEILPYDLPLVKTPLTPEDYTSFVERWQEQLPYENIPEESLALAYILQANSQPVLNLATAEFEPRTQTARQEELPYQENISQLRDAVVMSLDKELEDMRLPAYQKVTLFVNVPNLVELLQNEELRVGMANLCARKGIYEGDMAFHLPDKDTTIANVIWKARIVHPFDILPGYKPIHNNSAKQEENT